MTNKEIGDRIREAREVRNLTRDELAYAVGVSSKFMYEIETGRKGFSARKLIRISQALSVSCEFIMLGTGLDLQRKNLAEILSKFNNRELNKLDKMINTIRKDKK